MIPTKETSFCSLTFPSKVKTFNFFVIYFCPIFFHEKKLFSSLTNESTNLFFLAIFFHCITFFVWFQFLLLSLHFFCLKLTTPYSFVTFSPWEHKSFICLSFATSTFFNDHELVCSLFRDILVLLFSRIPKRMEQKVDLPDKKSN